MLKIKCVWRFCQITTLHLCTINIEVNRGKKFKRVSCNRIWFTVHFTRPPADKPHTRTVRVWLFYNRLILIWSSSVSEGMNVKPRQVLPSSSKRTPSFDVKNGEEQRQRKLLIEYCIQYILRDLKYFGYRQYILVFCFSKENTCWTKVSVKVVSLWLNKLTPTLAKMYEWFIYFRPKRFLATSEKNNHIKYIVRLDYVKKSVLIILYCQSLECYGLFRPFTG